MTNKEELREKLRELFDEQTDYLKAHDPLIDKAMHLIDEQTRAAYEQGYDDRTLEADHELEDAVRAARVDETNLWFNEWGNGTDQIGDGSWEDYHDHRLNQLSKDKDNHVS